MGMEGSASPWALGQKPIIWQDFCRKLHENEEIGRRGTHVSRASSDIFLTQPGSENLS